MKKSLAFALVVLIIVSSTLTGCGSKEKVVTVDFCGRVEIPVTVQDSGSSTHDFEVEYSLPTGGFLWQTETKERYQGILETDWPDSWPIVIREQNNIDYAIIIIMEVNGHYKELLSAARKQYNSGGALLFEYPGGQRYAMFWLPRELLAENVLPGQYSAYGNLLCKR